MKKLVPLMFMSVFALAACQTTETTEKPESDPTVEKPMDCSADPDNPQCETGGPAGGGPITNTTEECTPGDPDNPQCETGGPAGGGPITR